MKNKLKIILWIILFFTTNLVLALDVDFNVDKKELTMSDNLTINVIITWTWNMDNIDIWWIENFSLVWQNQSNITSDVNWTKQSYLNMRLVFSPMLTWEHEIWPITLRLWDEEIKKWDKTIKINVTNNQKQTTNTNNKIQKVTDYDNQKQTINDGSGITEELNDIDPVKTSIWKFVLIPILIILFFIIFYFLLKHFLKQEEKEEELKVEIKEIDGKEVLKSKLNRVKEKVNDLSKTNFYSILNTLFREYFEYLWIEKASKMTYDELKDTTLKDKEIFKLFEKSYFKEFDNSEDDSKIRLEIVDEFMEKMG